MRPAADDAEVRHAAAVAWPLVEAGQAGFPLAGLASEAALTSAWLKLLRQPGSDLLLAHDDGELVGACGLIIADPLTLQTGNGPVALHSHAEVYDALLAAIFAEHPRARLRVGVSSRHERAIAWLGAHGASLEEQLWPHVGTATATGPVPGVRSVTPEESERYVDLYDRLIGRGLWWTADRIVQSGEPWICLVDEEWESVLAARVIPGTTMTEVFALSATGPAVATRLLTSWLDRAARCGHHEALYFCDSQDERAAASAVGLTCRDEYLSFLVTGGSGPDPSSAGGTGGHAPGPTP